MRDRMRIVNLGLPKSGTTTLAHALRLSGLRIADYRIRKRQTPDTALHNAFVGDLMYTGYFGSGDPLNGLDLFDGFSEISTLREGHCLWPQMDWGLIAAIRDHHPGTKFLATWRPAEALSRSIQRWSNLGTERLPEGSVPGLPSGYGQSEAQLMRWIRGHYGFLQSVFRDDRNFLLLDVQAPDAVDTLGAYVGRDIPWWGIANRNPAAEPAEAD